MAIYEPLLIMNKESHLPKIDSSSNKPSSKRSLRPSSTRAASPELHHQMNRTITYHLSVSRRI
ncbi:unnamed protein product [Acidithrix sp. C25]|nr:unnamed protein product [Acidithrix sp. C25]